jgi:hypothetical protein
MPDLDLIKQEEQGRTNGRAASRSSGLWVSAYERTMNFYVRKKGDTALKCPNESEH